MEGETPLQDLSRKKPSTGNKTNLRDYYAEDNC